MVYDAMGVTFLLLRPASSDASHCGLSRIKTSPLVSSFIVRVAAIVTFQTRVDNHTGWGTRTTWVDVDPHVGITVYTQKIFDKI
jgi:hypothetical protein